LAAAWSGVTPVPSIIEQKPRPESSSVMSSTPAGLTSVRRLSMPLLSHVSAALPSMVSARTERPGGT
jgi:hypothetical protein